MPQLVTNLDAVLAAIDTLNERLPHFPKLAERLGRAHAFYVNERDQAEPLFGFSKFVGYDGLSPEEYLKKYKQLDGRNTELALQPWFVELHPESTAYRALFDKLAKWMAKYDQRPRGGKTQRVRLMVVRPELRTLQSAGDEDRRLLDLMIAAADLLPATQRLELRAAL